MICLMEQVIITVQQKPTSILTDKLQHYRNINIFMSEVTSVRCDQHTIHCLRRILLFLSTLGIYDGKCRFVRRKGAG
ncbi:unnamed protein product [Didymodactylos carnosus]|uniref:Uncharacterized protein n=1 Tax=Didymodactylos carnosus TaxID=1234261 RepID=A0A8S2GQI3_9BILA|nr:unnamed protein product [Didymodactylos carnosus]CAF3549181.1 unnamed protein product [Didymodactylos carnosus]